MQGGWLKTVDSAGPILDLRPQLILPRPSGGSQSGLAVRILRPIRARAARVRQHGGALGAACGTLEDTRSGLQWAEHGSLGGLRRIAGMVLRFILDILVVFVIVLFELDTLRRRAGSALAGPRRH